eukprot:TRINITY_DN5823_c0_g1_i1.p1 TRINITY_DN5823_c0_g1~~TRINITY_DN5823_c0_g1_i1.p1  ORF type:complete len:131 (-),score=6.06 TRINITY_DN5823_c0_g1_i1:6-398(-)
MIGEPTKLRIPKPTEVLSFLSNNNTESNSNPENVVKPPIRPTISPSVMSNRNENTPKPIDRDCGPETPYFEHIYKEDVQKISCKYTNDPKQYNPPNCWSRYTCSWHCARIIDWCSRIYGVWCDFRHHFVV